MSDGRVLVGLAVLGLLGVKQAIKPIRGWAGSLALAPYNGRESIGSYQRRDHAEVGRLLGRVRESLLGDGRGAYADFRAFSSDLERHLSSEEDEIFPKWKREHPRDASKINEFVRQHVQIRRLTRSLGRALVLGDVGSSLGALDRLLVMVRPHEAAEEALWPVGARGVVRRERARDEEPQPIVRKVRNWTLTWTPPPTWSRAILCVGPSRSGGLYVSEALQYDDGRIAHERPEVVPKYVVEELHRMYAEINKKYPQDGSAGVVRRAVESHRKPKWKTPAQRIVDNAIEKLRREMQQDWPVYDVALEQVVDSAIEQMSRLGPDDGLDEFEDYKVLKAAINDGYENSGRSSGSRGVVRRSSEAPGCDLVDALDRHADVPGLDRESFWRLRGVSDAIRSTQRTEAEVNRIYDEQRDAARSQEIGARLRGGYAGTQKLADSYRRGFDKATDLTQHIRSVHDLGGSRGVVRRTKAEPVHLRVRFIHKVSPRQNDYADEVLPVVSFDALFKDGEHKQIDLPYVRKIWGKAFPDLPLGRVEALPGHEKVILFNPSGWSQYQAIVLEFEGATHG